MCCIAGNDDTAISSATTATATVDNDADGGDATDVVILASSTTSKPYATLSAAAAKLKSLALKLSHRLRDDERFRITEDVAATLNIVLNSRRHSN